MAKLIWKANATATKQIATPDDRPPDVVIDTQLAWLEQPEDFTVFILADDGTYKRAKSFKRAEDAS